MRRMRTRQISVCDISINEIREHCTNTNCIWRASWPLDRKQSLQVAISGRLILVFCFVFLRRASWPLESKHLQNSAALLFTICTFVPVNQVKWLRAACIQKFWLLLRVNATRPLLFKSSVLRHYLYFCTSKASKMTTAQCPCWSSLLWTSQSPNPKP